VSYNPQSEILILQSARPPATAGGSDSMLGLPIRNQDMLRRLMLLALGLTILPFAILTIFSNPAYDDYCFAVRSMRLGFIEAQKSAFNTRFGRYFSTALLSWDLNFSGYHVFAFLFILLTLAAIYFLVAALLDSSATRLDKLIAAALVTALFSNQMPDITEGYYWLSGSVTYQLASILTLFLFALAIRALKGGKRSNLALVGCGLLIIAIVGCNETSMALLLFLLTGITVKAFSIRSTARWAWVALLGVAMLCALVVILAPGNAVRGSYYPNKHRLFFSLGFALIQEARYLLKWITNPALVLSTILFVPIAGKLLRKSNLVKNQLRIHPLTALLFLLGLVFLGFFPAYWSTGLLGQLRTVNTVYLFFLIGWFLNVCFWVEYFERRRPDQKWELPTYAYIICLTLVPLTLVLTNNTKAAFADLAGGRAYTYDQQRRKRNAQFEQCAQEHTKCEFTPISALPLTTANPYFETNFDCEAWYWELKGQTAKP